LGYQTPNKDLKGLFHQSDSESCGDECCKKLYVMYGGSSELVSRRDVKTVRREVLSVKPGMPNAAPHQRWKSTAISFRPSDCPENMAGTGVLPLVTTPTIANVRLHHVLIDGGAGLTIISYAAFKHLQIPEGTVISHYGYLVLKMLSPVGVLTMQSDRTAAVVAVEKLHALAAGLAPTTGVEGSDPSSSRAKAPAKAPKVHPFDTDDVPVKTVQVGANASQITRIGGNLGEK
jgi:hypothetical protein